VLKISTLRTLARKYWALVMLSAIIIFILLTALGKGSTGLRLAGIIAMAGFYLAASITILRASRKMPKTNLNRAWTFISIGLILWVTAYCAEAVLQVFSSQQLPIPSVIDLVRYAGLIGIAVGFAIYPETQERIFRRIRALLDISILSVGAIIIFWMVILRSILLSGLVDLITAVWIEARVGLDLIWMVLLLRLFMNAKDRSERAVFLFLGLGAFIQTVVDLFSGFVKMNVLHPDPGILEAGWMVSGFLILYGSSHLFTERVSDPSPAWLPTLNRPFRFEPLLPAAMTYIIIGFVGLDWLLMGKLDQVVLPILALMAILLIARQGVIAGQSEIRQHAELVNSTTDFAFTFDSKGTIRLANPTLQTFLGIDPDQELLSKVDDFLRVNASLDEILTVASEAGWSGEAQFSNKDGTTLPVSVSIKCIQDERESPQLYAAIAYDLTETKLREGELRNALRQLAETEEDLRRLNRELEAKVEARTQELEGMVSHLARLNEELKALDQLKSDFVALVSHELRAPLTNIRTGLEVLLRGSSELTKNADDSLQLILKETERLSSFVEMILDLSALEAGRFQLRIRPILAAKVMDDVVMRFSNQPGHDRIQVELPKSLPLILADEQALHSILFHLIDNGLKYTTEGDVMIRGSEQDEKVVFQIIDCGPGIPEEERERVFEMFYRLDTSDSRKIYGRGLGLNLAKRFLDRMGGGIEIMESEKGGTLVEFWLPRHSTKDI
jgi:PAS domain S-box-containing protein